MKIISGKYRGKNLQTLVGDSTRPTTSRVKESIFNIIQFNIMDSDVLDLFAGCGQMGIECLSRGAKFCDFNDNNKAAFSIIKSNLKELDTNYSLSSVDYKDFLKRANKQYDLIFLDPPYRKNLINDTLFLIKDFKLLKKNGIIVCESNIDDMLDLENLGFYAEKTYKYGTIIITKVKEISDETSDLSR